MNLDDTVFIISNKGVESNTILDILQQQPGVNVMISNQSRFKESTWQNVEGEIRFNVNKFREQHCEYEVDNYLGKLPCIGTLKEALAANGENIKSIINVIGINLNGPELYQGEHIHSTPEVSALEKVADLLDIDLTFDQVFVAAYARGGVSEIVTLGKALQMREDELIFKIVDIKMRDYDELKHKNEFYDYNFGKNLSLKECCKIIEIIENTLHNPNMQKHNNVQILTAPITTTLGSICQKLLQEPLLIKNPNSDVKYATLYASEDICSKIVNQFKDEFTVGKHIYNSEIIYIPNEHINDTLDYVNNLTLEQDIEPICTDTDIEIDNE